MKLFLESEKFPEQYKLDLEIVYLIKDADIDVPSDIVLDTLSETILSEITANKKKICKGTDFKDFEIESDYFNESDGVLTYQVNMRKKIVGKYFVDNLSLLLKNYETIVYYNNVEYQVRVNLVYPMLRYIGES